MAIEVTKQIYKPSMTVGQVYARVYGSQALPMPIGNVLELGLEHISPTNVVVKKGAASAGATPVDMALNYEVRHEGIYLLPDAKDVLATDKLWVSYGYGAYAAIEALTTKAVELELIFGGMNEADSGNPVVVNIFRASQGVTKALTLIGKGFNALDVEGTVLMDPTKTGAGLSKYYRARVA